MSMTSIPTRLRPKQFDLIAFDWDGTLYDSTAAIVMGIQRAAVDLGMPEPSRQAASYVIGLGLQEALAHAVPGLLPQDVATMVERYRFHYQQLQSSLTLFEGTTHMLQQLKARHHWLAVATGKSRVGLNHALESSELKGVFDDSRTADETASKPSPVMLYELMSSFGVPAERTLMVGDTTHDLQMAQNAGVPSVAVSFGAHSSESFQAYQPLFVAHSTHELSQWLLDHA